MGQQSLRKNEKEYGVKLHQIDFIRTPYDLRNIKAYKQLVQLMKRKSLMQYIAILLLGVYWTLSREKVQSEKDNLSSTRVSFL